MSEVPTYPEVVRECAQIEQYVSDPVRMDEYVERALDDVRQYLRNILGIEWATVYDSDNAEYFADTDGNTNNQTQLLKIIRLMTIAIIYKDNAQGVSDSPWWEMYEAYKVEATQLMDSAKFDIDANEDGEISEDEETQTTQTFFQR